MTGRWHRFRVEIAGEWLYGVAFGSESELEAFLASRSVTSVQMSTQPGSTAEPIRRGRRSFDAMLAAAATAIHADLIAADSVAARARLVLRHLAKSHGAEELPSDSTVRAFLTENPVAENVAENSANKSRCARVRRTGGTKC